MIVFGSMYKTPFPQYSTYSFTIEMSQKCFLKETILWVKEKKKKKKTKKTTKKTKKKKQSNVIILRLIYIMHILNAYSKHAVTVFTL